MSRSSVRAASVAAIRASRSERNVATAASVSIDVSSEARRSSTPESPVSSCVSNSAIRASAAFWPGESQAATRAMPAGSEGRSSRTGPETEPGTRQQQHQPGQRLGRERPALLLLGVFLMRLRVARRGCVFGQPPAVRPRRAPASVRPARDPPGPTLAISTSPGASAGLSGSISASMFSEAGASLALTGASASRASGASRAGSGELAAAASAETASATVSSRSPGFRAMRLRFRTRSCRWHLSGCSCVSP